MKATEMQKLLNALVGLPRETEWLEFKHNNAAPDDIGEYISAIANAATLHGQDRGYIVWGVEDGTRALLGTTFEPREMKIGNEELENWLSTQLAPRIHFEIHEADIAGKHFAVIQVPAANHTPVRFKEFDYIRVGTYKKKLRDYPEKERAIWLKFATSDFESGIALASATSDQVLSLIDYPNYFRMMGQPLPDNRAAILERLKAERIIKHKDDDHFDITNLGALLFARSLGEFGSLSRKALRVVIYRGENRVETVKEQPGGKGYAVGFEGAIRYINDQLPENEQIGQALRREVPMFPKLAIRELVANALIHQDFSVTGAGPIVEIFSNRMEVTNPGKPLIDTLRFIDEPPRSRNESLASIMRRLSVCEERGSGIDKVISQVELYQLPPPDFRATDGSTVTVLYGPREFAKMDRTERIRACYQHACLWFVSGKRMTNASLRQRLGIKDSNYPVASRVLRDTLDAELIKAHASGSESKKDASYVPFWA